MQNGWSGAVTMADFDIVSYLMGKATGSGGGVTILSGNTEPSAGQGNNGQIYLRYLPNEYVPVEYIQSDGSQYIDTQYIPTVHTAAELKLNAQNIQESAILGSGWQINGFFLMFLKLNLI